MGLHVALKPLLFQGPAYSYATIWWRGEARSGSVGIDFPIILTDQLQNNLEAFTGQEEEMDRASDVVEEELEEEEEEM